MSATFSTQIEELNDGIEFWPVLRHVAESGEAGLRIVKTFALDCAERALPAYEAKYPGDLRVRAAIEVSRRYLRGEATIDEVKTAANAAYAAAYAADAAAAARAADAGEAAARAAAARAVTKASNNAGVNAGYAAEVNAARAAEAAAYAAANHDAERRWQRAHLIKLLEAAE